MRKATMILTASVLCIPALAACSSGGTPSEPTTVTATATTTVSSSSSSSSTPETTVTETATETYTEAPSTSTSSEDPGIDDDAINDAAIELAWEYADQESRDSICTGWALDKELMIDSFMAGESEGYSRTDVRDFFDGKCL